MTVSSARLSNQKKLLIKSTDTRLSLVDSVYKLAVLQLSGNLEALP